MTTRRDWLCTVAVLGAGAVVSRTVRAQDPAQAKLPDTSNLFAMDQAAARSVRLAPKPNAIASMTPDDRDALEHRLRCQCGCTLDVYTCRTTDFSCQVSPAMHRDIMALVDGGYTAQEILDAFVNSYGERVLMAPPKVGFNVLGYVMPGIVLAVGAIVLAVMLRGWKRPAPATPPQPLRGTPEELARLDAVIRDDS